MIKPDALPLIAPLPAGESFPLPIEWFKSNDERGIIARLILNKEYFGACFRQFHPIFFETEIYKGVVVSMLVASQELNPDLRKPGDVDILIIPYTDKSLVFSEAIAVEAKVIRASYAKQTKSPNQYGFSQAKGLWDIGFPYVAVAHFIVSDKSPRNQWVKKLQATIGKNESIEDISEVDVDYLPVNLRESFG